MLLNSNKYYLLSLREDEKNYSTLNTYEARQSASTIAPPAFSALPQG